MKEQLTLNDLCGYLPFKLKLMHNRDNWHIKEPETIVTLDGIADVSGLMPSNYGNRKIDWFTIFYRENEKISGNSESTNFKPIFRNLATDLTREITHGNKTFNPYDVLFNENPHDAERAHGLLIKNYGFKYVPYWIIEKLRFWHFWLGDQSYFEKGIILDYNDVNGL